MKQTVIINGYETEIEVVGNQPQHTTVHGNEDKYSIYYGNGLIEYGGNELINLENQFDGVMEGKVTVYLESPLSNWLSTQVTVSDVPNRVGERASIIKKDSESFEIHASVNGSEPAEMKVYWSVKGVL